jgi:hypothetical protein
MVTTFRKPQMAFVLLSKQRENSTINSSVIPLWKTLSMGAQERRMVVGGRRTAYTSNGTFVWTIRSWVRLIWKGQREVSGRSGKSSVFSKGSKGYQN